MSSNDFNVTVDYIGHEWEVVGTYTPERPPPMVQNHDSPGFSDPGDGEELEFDSIDLHFTAKQDGAKQVSIPLAAEFIEFLYEDNEFYSLVIAKIGTSYGDDDDRGDYEYEREKDRRLGL